MKRAPKIGQKIPTVTLGGEDALLLEQKTRSAVSNAAWAAQCLRNLLPEILRSDLDRALVRKETEILIVVEEANKAAQWAADYLRDEIDPHRAAIKAVLEAETTEAFDAAAKPAEPVRVKGKRGRK